MLRHKGVILTDDERIRMALGVTMGQWRTDIRLDRLRVEHELSATKEVADRLEALLDRATVVLEQLSSAEREP